MREDSRAEPSEHPAECAAGDGQLEAFGEQLLHEPRTGGTQRHPNRQLSLPRGGAGEQQVTDVRARDQEHDRDARHQHDENLSILAAQIDFRRREASAEIDGEKARLRAVRRRIDSAAAPAFQCETTLAVRPVEGRAGGADVRSRRSSSDDTQIDVAWSAQVG